MTGALGALDQLLAQRKAEKLMAAQQAEAQRQLQLKEAFQERQQRVAEGTLGVAERRQRFEEQPQPEAPYTLSPGQSRFAGPQVIGSVPATPPAPPELQDVMRVNPRTGRLETLGQTPKGTHFVTEPPSPPDRSVANELGRMRIDAAREKLEVSKQATTNKRNASIRMVEDTIGVIDELRDPNTGKLRPGLTPAIGGSRMAGGALLSMIPGSPEANARASLNRLKSQMVVDLIKEMKGQSQTGATGFGQLNLKELETLQQAASKLDPNQSEEVFAQELGRIRDKLHLVYQDQGVEAPSVKPTAADLIKKYGGR